VDDFQTLLPELGVARRALNWMKPGGLLASWPSQTGWDSTSPSRDAGIVGDGPRHAPDAVAALSLPGIAGLSHLHESISVLGLLVTYLPIHQAKIVIQQPCTIRGKIR
jgi:hypothetical protein